MKNRMSSRISPRLKNKTVIYTVASLVSITVVTIVILIYLNMGVTKSALAAPPIDISGVVNSYLRVSAFSSGTRTFTANNLSGNINHFQAGKTVMVYQVKGASINTTNSSNYGNITSFNHAGNYEFTIITSISGGPGSYTIVVQALENNYASGDVLQLISIPEYADANVTGTVTAIPWNAAQGRGGVVAFQVANELTLNSSVNVSGQGFTGGQKGGSDGGCPSSTTYKSNSDAYGAKGESISTDGQLYARGAQATGGGGGNPHNAGGGGGSNFTYGGNGGQGWQPGGSCTNANAGGIGGKKINYSSFSKVMLGGGGGSGQQNDGLASNGASGGGVIIVRARTIKSSCGGTYGFIADGQNAANTTGNDAAGGGGGGGVVVLDVENYDLTCDIVVRANGGNGGNVNDGGAHGGGGGGGIGVIMETYPTSNAHVTLFSSPGTNGRDCNTSACNTPTGAAPETPSSYKIGMTSIPGTVIPLPVELTSFTGKPVEDGVQLDWVTASEKNNDFFTLERSTNGTDFNQFEEVDGAGNSSKTLYYSTIDHAAYTDKTYYRLKQTDYDGKFAYSKVIYVETNGRATKEFKIFPNPASQVVNVTNYSGNTFTIRIVNQRGAEVLRETISESTQQIDVSSLEEGIYVVEVVNVKERTAQRLVIKR